MPDPPIKAIFFDFMGTCLDWYSSIISALPSQLPDDIKCSLALEWRQRYFDGNAQRQAAGHPPEDIDVTHRRTLSELLGLPAYEGFRDLFTLEVMDKLMADWHHQPAWPDVAPALAKLKARGYELFVHANGTTRLQLDLVRSSGLAPYFSMLFSSELLGAYKPAPENYRRVLQLVKYEAEECVTVAAHAYDLRGAKLVGMKGVYVYRWTDDVREDQKAVKEECEGYLEDGMRGLVDVIGEF